MGYRTGSITSANPAADLYAQIEAEFNLHANWDFVDTVTIGSNTHKVWKNRGTGSGANAFGQDFFLDFQYAASAGTTLRVRAFELYDSVNDKCAHPCVPTASSLAINADGSWGDATPGVSTGYTLENTNLVYAEILTVTTAFDYFIQVAVNKISVAAKFSTTNTALYAGVFEPLMAADPFPLCIVATSGNENSLTDCGVSRHPNKTTTAADNFKFQCEAYNSQGGNAATADLFHNAAFASRILLRHINSAGTSDAAIYGRNRGLLYNCVYLPDGGTATVNGDTMTSGAETYTKMKFGTFNLSAGGWVRQAAP